MSGQALGDLAAELDLWGQSGRGVRLWLRDDDAIAPSPALGRLAELSERFALPVLLAVIPMLAQLDLAGALKGMPTLLPCQHGCSHHNHAPVGVKKSEFGSERVLAEVEAELGLARRRLGDLLGPAMLDVFVPPWNRIGPETVAILPRLGFAGLSCFRGFTLGAEGGPSLANSDIDVMDWHGGRVGRPLAALATEITAQLSLRRARGEGGPATLGLLLHHRDHDETAWTALEALLAGLARHPAVTPIDPRQLFSLPMPA